jgi:hypothetical protein
VGPRLAACASALMLLSALVSPCLAHGDARDGYRVTIAAIPPHNIAGRPVLIYGQIQGPGGGGQTIVLYQRVKPSSRSAIAGTATTNAQGYYEFTRAEDVVMTNRSWFVRAPSLPGSVHSRTIHERVAATVSIGAFTSAGVAAVTAYTRHPIVLAGHVDPPGVHLGEPVALQQRNATNYGWRTLAGGVIGLGSRYSISYRFALPGTRELRVLFGGDARNATAVSDTITIAIAQTQNPAFTVNTRSAVIAAGQSAAISGVLYMPAGTTSAPVADPHVPVTLLARAPGGRTQAVDHGTTGADGSYRFTVSPRQNTSYIVQTTFVPPAIRRSASVLEAVPKAVTISPAKAAVAAGQPIAISGEVSSGTAGEPVYLQLLGKDGHFHGIGTALLGPASAYQFKLWLGPPGIYQLRTRAAGDDANASGYSPAVAIAVSPSPVASLPAAS